MLSLFRRYQRHIYLVVTVVTVISFSFFGTFGTLAKGRTREVIAFNDVAGKAVTRDQLEELVAFLSSDAQDKLVYGGSWGPNFLNDGVIAKDILATGLGELLVEQFDATLQLQQQAEGRLERERRYRPYRHPQAPFIAAEAIWGYFVPQLTEQLKALQSPSANEESGSQLFARRAALFLAQKQLPAPLLKQMLFQQQKQYRWLKEDGELPQRDLSLFGYHRLDDWFGPRFTRLVAEFILNSSELAKERGYQVSSAEALADLMRQAATSYQQYRPAGINDSSDYFREQLRRMGLAEQQAVSLWQKVLLFRRLFQDVGAAALVDRFTFEQVANYTREGASGTLYSLPASLQLSDFEALQEFEVYLRAVAKAPPAKEGPLALPNQWLSVDKVAQNYPSLVQKRYLLEMASIDKRLLEARITLNEMWDWQQTEEGWRQLTEKFPQLAVAKAKDQEQRILQLDRLDQLTRQKVDRFSRTAIIDSRPRLLAEALEESPKSKQQVALISGVASEPFSLADNSSLMALLDAAPLQESERQDPEAMEAQRQLSQWSGDGQLFYAIVVVERDEKPSILSFSEARAKGVLRPLVDKALEDYYVKVREKQKALYQLTDGSGEEGWKPFSSVKDQLARRYFQSVTDAIRSAAAPFLSNEQEPSLDQLSSLRFASYMAQAREAAVEKGTEGLERYVAAQEASSQVRLTDQWKLEPAPFSVDRASPSERTIDLQEALALAPKAWSSLHWTPSGEISFFQVSAKKVQLDERQLRDKVLTTHRLLSHEARRLEATALCQQMKEKGAISLDFMEARLEEEPSSVATMEPLELEL